MGKINKNTKLLLPVFSPSTKYLPSTKISYFDDSKEDLSPSDMSTTSPRYTAPPCRSSTDSVNNGSLLSPSGSEQSPIPDDGVTIYLSHLGYLARILSALFALVPLIIYFFRLRDGTIAAIVFLFIVMAESFISLQLLLLSFVRVRIEMHNRPVHLRSGSARVGRPSGMIWRQVSDIAMTIALLVGVCATGHRGDHVVFVGIYFHWAAL